MPASPANAPVAFLLLVMLPIAIWIAPPPLRQEYALPRAAILLWNASLYFTLVAHAGRARSLLWLATLGFSVASLAVASVALFGTNWSEKFPTLQPWLQHLPRPLAGVFEGAEDGFNANQVAGSLLYSLPLLLALTLAEFRRPRALRLLWLLFSTGVIGLVFVASQSRGAFFGLGIGMLFMLLAPWRWGRWLLLGLAGVGLTALLWLPLSQLWAETASNYAIASSVGKLELAGRQELWQRALYGIEDFPLSGMGLGTFRRLVYVLYPFADDGFQGNFGHAHNFFLQTALDFGLPGLTALLALYLLALFQCYRLWHRSDWSESRVWAIGFLATLLAQTTFSLADAVAMGAKTNFLFWYLFGLIFATAALPQRRRKRTLER
jgi:O-antigen ligase